MAAEPSTTDGRRQAWLRHSLSDVVTDDFRPDVEGLRAVAVLAVVLFHVGLVRFSGGFVGVDVFFVLSGFLITRLLVRELAATGTISLPKFWARRARRLLPASVLVIVVTVVASRFMLSPVALRPLAIDAVAAGGFAVNFVFAHRLGDYFGSQLGQIAPSPLLHFWSLAVEEQFYLVWPALMLLLSRRPRQYRRLLIVTIVGLTGASIVASVWLTDHHPTWAFYLLPARMGELLAGALVALGGGIVAVIPATWRAAAGWIGLAGIAAVCLSFDGSTNFPGTAAMLPVLATVLVIVAGGVGASAYGPSVLLHLQPLQWIGRRSYAIYLWHWPVLVLAEAKFGPLNLAQRLVAVAAAMVLADVSLHIVEDPAHHSAWLAWRPARGLGLGAALCATAVLTGWISLTFVPSLSGGQVAAAPALFPVNTVASASPSDSATDQPAAPATDPASLSALPQGDLDTLINANRAVLEQGLQTRSVPSNLRPSLSTVAADRPQIYPDGCVAIGVDETVNPCSYGNPASKVKVVLYGDSHAAQWFPALQQIATANGFQLIVLTKGGCPTAAVSIPTATLARTCPVWRDKAIQFIATQKPAMVIVASWYGYPNTDAQWSSGFQVTMARLAPLTQRLVVLGDNPGAQSDPGSCLSSHVRSVQSCTNNRTKAVKSGRLVAEKEVATADRATFIDTSDWLCTATTCPMIIGDILLFRDPTHLTTVAVNWFRPLLEAAVIPILKSG